MQKIYVLQCENNKYYVGKTSNIDQRLAQHFSQEGGSEWTKLHPPQEMIDVRDMTGDYDEMNATLECMKKYGIDNVRGAQWSNTILTQEQKSWLLTNINPNACFHCGRNGHFSNNCPNRNQVDRTQQSIRCHRCGQNGHFANVCNNNYNRMVCARCGRNNHSEKNCYATFDIDDEMLDCARCGRDTHCADECYATTDVDGRRLR
jgi:predicted GIY-YIG superfamily endonuclease